MYDRVCLFFIRNYNQTAQEAEQQFTFTNQEIVIFCDLF